MWRDHVTKTIRNDLISELRQKNDQNKQIVIVMLKADGIIVDMPKPNYVSLIITIMETNVGTKITLSSLDARAPTILLSFQSYPNLKILKMCSFEILTKITGSYCMQNTAYL